MKVLDLFCGAGGLSLGFRDAGFSVLGADINQYSAEIYSINNIGKFIEIDLARDSVAGTFDVVIGGLHAAPVKHQQAEARLTSSGLQPARTVFDHIFEIRPRHLFWKMCPLGSDEKFLSLKDDATKEGYSVDSQSLEYLDFGVATKDVDFLQLVSDFE